jgi:hypothetical protein
MSAWRKCSLYRKLWHSWNSRRRLELSRTGGEPVTDPSLIDFPTPPQRELPRRQPDQPIPPDQHPANDELGMPEDIEERTPLFWVPLAIAGVLMIGIGIYFIGLATVG